MNGLKLPTVFLLMAIGLSQEVVPSFAKSITGSIDNETLVSEHNMFFQGLTNEEKNSIMRLAIHYFDADHIKIKPFPVELSSKASIESKSPFPGENPAPDVPETLVSHFLNGKVPKDFQKEFTKWLRRQYHLSDKHLNNFRTTGEFCFPGEECPILDDIGGMCCPFG